MKIVKNIFIFVALSFSGIVFSDYPPPLMPVGTFDAHKAAINNAIEEMNVHIWNGEMSTQSDFVRF